ncbi:EmrB/QacA subfamily drug resistance transporter [Pedobacter africanus]|uniref:EmrB/QacA subfamily drug resistance transporter n=1 Tax=Pedobacter africanus TaxID=151894 RepID=A0ACC6KU31_9SPHI|nr:MFS transporter [Pedobacter africanus]MDR6782647.1 EmrB/QacA subfamily drug resistance transporter [Pedobacter africanus]
MHNKKKNNLTLAAICLSSLMFGLEISSVPVLLPSLEKILHGSFTDVQWIMNAYTIACTTVLMATGTLADRYGRKLVFVIGLVLFGITSLLCGLATNMPLLIVSRFLQGLGGGIMLICQIAILSHQFQEGPQRSKAFAMWGIIFGIGLGFGPLIGGLILSFSSWKWVFLVHFPLSIFTLGLALAGISESKNTQAQRLDVWGMISLSLAVFALIYFIIQGPVLGFGSTAALFILAGAVFAFLLFLYAEKTFAQPMFDFTVFKVRNFSGAIIGSIGMNFCFWPFMIYLPIYFQGVLGYSSLFAGTVLLAYTLPTLVVPPLAERLLLKYRPGIVIPFGLFSIGLGFILMWLGIRAAHPGWLSMLPGTLLSGIGLGFCNTPVTNTTTGSVSSDRAGMASGIDMSARLITLAINIALMGLVLSKGISTHLKATFTGSFSSTQLQGITEKIAAGNMNGLGRESQAALSYGFELLTLFSGIGVWILAILSFYLFKPNLRPAKA